MTYVLLNAITLTRLVVCIPLWWWCWARRPRRMVLWMSLDLAWFVTTDVLDGAWARSFGLVSTLGYWLDHSADFVFYGSLFVTMWLGTREAAAKRRHRRTVAIPPRPPPAPPPA